MVAGLVRTVEHLRLADRPGLAAMVNELEETAEHLAGLRNLVGAVWEGEKDLEP